MHAQARTHARTCPRVHTCAMPCAQTSMHGLARRPSNARSGPPFIWAKTVACCHHQRLAHTHIHTRMDNGASGGPHGFHSTAPAAAASAAASRSRSMRSRGCEPVQAKLNRLHHQVPVAALSFVAAARSRGHVTKRLPRRRVQAAHHRLDLLPRPQLPELGRPLLLLLLLLGATGQQLVAALGQGLQQLLPLRMRVRA